MNFRYMPELEWRFGYPVVIVVSIVIAVSCLLYFKKKKWL
jgi:magnesium transporter